jgi:hypothetical protein
VRPYVPRFALAILDGPVESPLRPVDVAVFGELLESLVRINVAHLRAHPDLPTFYDAVRLGLVRYVDPGTKDDPWSDLVCCLATGVVDCEDASAWVVADYRVRGGRPRARCVFRAEPTPDGRRQIHIAVDDGTGRLEDPSIAAGMR